jgi:hypothetical protein
MYCARSSARFVITFLIPTAISFTIAGDAGRIKLEFLRQASCP